MLSIIYKLIKEKKMNKNLKTIITLTLLSIVFSLFFAGCNNTSEGSSTNDEITIVSREDGSGTRTAFVELVGIKEGKNDMTTQRANFQDGNGKVIETVKNDTNAIGYASLGSVAENKEVKLLKVNNVEANSQNILNGKYPIARPFNIAWKKNATLKPQVSDFINFILSKQGQEVVSDKNMYITINPNAKNFEKGKDIKGEIMVTGSTSVAPLMEKLAEAYMKINANVTIKVSSTGSSAGMKDAINGNNDLGMASRGLKEEESAELEHTVIAKDGIAMIVSANSSLENISIDNIIKIYKGEISKWGEMK